jgi:excinuclease UvrABC nuclease subunit
MKVNFFKKIKLPDKSGVYFFLNKGKILYIGKATSLKDRVKSYFGKELINTRGPLLVDMVFKADEIKWQETDSVLESLILEANLIKKYQPYYNTKEKSDKSFNYVCITKEDLPKVVVLRGKNLIKNNYQKVFGPFTNGSQLREGLRIIRKIFPFLDEKSKLNHEFYRQLNLVPNLDERKKYLNNIKNIQLLFEGKKKSILINLKKEMSAFAKEQKFERANEIKRQIFALNHINDVSLIKEEKISPENFSGQKFSGGQDEASVHGRKLLPRKVFRLEAYDIAHMSGQNMVGVMVVIEDGEVNKNEYRKFKIKSQKGANDTGALSEVLERRFAHPEWRYPDVVVMDGSVAQVNVAQKFLTGKNLKIEIVAVVKDDKHKAREIKGAKNIVAKYKGEILLANSEAHRFAINYHKNMRNKNFLKIK